MYLSRLHYTLLIAVAAIVSLAVATPAAVAQTPSKEKEQELIAVLRSEAPGGEKALACKGLAVHGSKESVGDLARLLENDKLASWARIALEVIPGPEADEALRKASVDLEGRLLIGTINSIGVRRDADAVEILTARLQDSDTNVAAAAAVALGRIGNVPATKALRPALASTTGPVRSAVAEGCILCAERLLAEGNGPAATEIYDEVRNAKVPQTRIQEATRGAIVARGTAGIPLLMEQLKSTDKGLFNIGLSVARELPGQEVTDALASGIAEATPPRAALLLYALGDREMETVPTAVLEAIKSGPKPVRMAAISVVGKWGDATSLATLLEIAAEPDLELAQSAKTALAGLPGEKINAKITDLLADAEGKTLPVLIELVGQRRIDATPALVKALDHSDAKVRTAALSALGETVGPQQISVLISQVVSRKHPADAEVAQKALRAACVRMPERESTAAALAAAMPKAEAATKASLLETLGAVGGSKALETITAAVKSKDVVLQDTGTRVLGEWMTVDAGPSLLDLAKTAPGEKYQIRALRGYIRLARQFTMPDKQRAEMCQNALAASTRDDEQQLVLAVLERYPSMDTLGVAVKAIKTPALKDDATRVAMVIAQKVGDKPAAREVLAKNGVEPVKLEIVKAEYGADSRQKDVTAVLRKQAGDFPLIVLPATTYTASFGGDPAPGTPKQLKVQYKIDGQAGEASFKENAAILLPAPK